MRAANARSRTTPTLLDVARHAGVSISTASRALNGHPGVYPDKVDRVRAAARELGYIADATARAVSGGTSSTLAIMLIASGRPANIQLIRGAVAAAAEYDLAMLVAEIDPDGHDQAAVVRRIRAHRPRSIILIGDADSLDADTVGELTSHRAHGGHTSTLAIPHQLDDPADAWWSVGQEAVCTAVKQTMPATAWTSH